MKQQRQTTASFALSIALHVLFGGVLVRALTYSLPHDDLDLRGRGESRAERIAFVAVPRQGATTTSGRSGGDGRPRSARPVPRLRAPSALSSVLPPVAPAAAEQAGSGEVVGEGGPDEGIRPTFADPRLWAPVGPFVSTPLPPAQRLDSSLTARLRAHRDSVTAATYVPNKMERGDWTMERDGAKYGIDRKYIHLGKFQLPTAALALLPFNRQANPIAGERERRLSATHADIQYQARRSMNYAEFRDAARAIRERKDRERAAALRAAGRSGTDPPG